VKGRKILGQRKQHGPRHGLRQKKTKRERGVAGQARNIDVSLQHEREGGRIANQTKREILQQVEWGNLEKVFLGEISFKSWRL